jgi:nucleoside-diphosphate-sugar epimerase
MAVLITGNRGFVGSHLAPFLKEQGYKIIFFEGDVSNKTDVDNFRTGEKIEAVVHLAAAINRKNKEDFYRVNVLGTGNIIDLCRRLNAGRLIFLSTIKVLSSLTNPYNESKKQAEKLVADSGLPHIILRPSMIYGPGDKSNLGFLLKMAKKMPLMPFFDFKIQPLYVADLVKIIAACLDAPTNKILNITGQEIISMKDILEILKKSDYKFLAIPVPNFFIKLCAILPFFPMASWQIKSLFSNEIYESSGWEELFGLKATPFNEAIEIKS